MSLGALPSHWAAEAVGSSARSCGAAVSLDLGRPAALLGFRQEIVALTAGIFVNAYHLEVPQSLRLWRIDESRSGNRTKREIERELGVAVWFSGSVGYSLSPVPGGSHVDVLSAEDPPLTSFAIREALRNRAATLAWDQWLAMNELNVVPPNRSEQFGPVLVDPVLKARVAYEGMGEAEHIAILSSGVRWRMAASLEDSQLAAVAPGETAYRLQGSGPERATVLNVDGTDLFLRVGREELDRPVSAADYSLVARPALVHSYLADTVGDVEARDHYRELLVASGTLMADVMSPNRYAVKERYQNTEALMAEFGRSWELATGGTIEVATAPIEIFVRPRA